MLSFSTLLADTNSVALIHQTSAESRAIVAEKDELFAHFKQKPQVNLSLARLKKKLAVPAYRFCRTARLGVQHQNKEPLANLRKIGSAIGKVVFRVESENSAVASEWITQWHWYDQVKLKTLMRPLKPKDKFSLILGSAGTALFRKSKTLLLSESDLLGVALYGVVERQEKR